MFFFFFHKWRRSNICRAFKGRFRYGNTKPACITKAKFTLVLASWVSIKYVTCSFDVSEMSKCSTTHVNQWHIVTFSLTYQNSKTYHSECKTDVVLLTWPQSSGSVQATVITSNLLEIASDHPIFTHLPKQPPLPKSHIQALVSKQVILSFSSLLSR